MTMRIFATLLLMSALTSACTSTADPTETSAPAETSGPSRFPDMSGYTPADPEEYEQHLDNPGRTEKIISYYFDTPDNIQCSFNQFPLAVCTGNNLPAIPAARCDPPAGIYHYNSISTNRGVLEVNGSTCGKRESNKVLPPFHTLTVYGVICGVDDQKTTACKDPQGRGFVLSPAWSGWLEHV